MVKILIDPNATIMDCRQKSVVIKDLALPCEFQSSGCFLLALAHPV